MIADDFHEISYLIFFGILGKMSQNLSSAAVVICALIIAPFQETMVFIAYTSCTDLDKNFEHKIVNIFLPSSFNICFGCSKEPSH